jgi:hypothetical protein
MPIERNSEQFSHIRFERVPERQPERQKRGGFNPRRPPTPDDRPTHAIQIDANFTQAITEVTETRQRVGINPQSLFVLEFNTINLDLRSSIDRYGAWIVEEYTTKDGDNDRDRFLVQFPDETSRQRFLEDLRLYQSGSQDRATLPQAERSNFFDALQEVRKLSRSERMGIRLQTEGFPESETFYVDVDLWHPPDESRTREVKEQIRTLCRNMNGAVLDEVATVSLLLARIRCDRQLAEALLDLDLVARIDLPPRLATAYTEIFNTVPPPILPLPTNADPMVCVVDSGVLSGHPFLIDWVIEERDFDTGENTPTDLNGHGTSVAGLVVYGSVAECLESQTWQPKVRICSAKVLQNDEFNRPTFPDDRRVEAITEEAIRYFVTDRQCKVFNLSLGIEDEVYADGRQFAWAEKLDELVRELDIVIVLSSGNRSNPPIPESANTREEFQEAVRNNLLADPAQRLCNPATAALALTVGAIASSDALGLDDSERGIRLHDAFAGAPLAAPTPFTRVGHGYAANASSPPVKPDLVDYGGNYALQTIASGNPRWMNHHLNLGEPTLCLEQNGRFISTRTGTSFAAPHVAHAAAIAATSLEAAIGRQPSANLIRALIGSATDLPPCPEGWLGDENDILRLVGYGICSVEDLTWSRKNRVRLIAMDTIESDRLHFYRVEIPQAFLTTRGKRGITVSLAYDPPVRASRREYLARTMLVEALQGLTTEEVELYRAKRDAQEDLTLPSGAEIDLRPTKNRLQWSTLQVRRKTWQRNPSIRIPNGESEPVIHFVVRCQQRFPSENSLQKYGLVVLFWHESEQIELYQTLQNRVALRSTRVRVNI